MLLRDERGITLLEAVVALAIVGLAAVAALATAGAELRAATRGRTAIEAAALAQERMARAVLMPDSGDAGAFGAPLDGYRWTIRRTDPADEPGAQDVTVTMHWDGGEYALATRVWRAP